MRKLTINGHKMPCRCCGRNAKHIFDLGWRIGVYCDRHYETTVQFAELVEFYTSMSDEYQIHKDVLTSGYTGVMNGIYDPLPYMKDYGGSGMTYTWEREECHRCRLFACCVGLDECRKKVNGEWEEHCSAFLPKEEKE